MALSLYHTTYASLATDLISLVDGIAKIDNFTIFIVGAMKGEKVKILIVKVNTSHAFRKSDRDNKSI